MNLNLKSLAWWFAADATIIITWKLFAPDRLDQSSVIALFASSIILWLIFDRKKR